MAFETALPASDLPKGSMKAIKFGPKGETEILLVHMEDGTLHAVEASCPHAGAPLAQGALCDHRLICPWHAGTFALGDAQLPDGALVEPPALRALKRYPVQLQGDSILVDCKAVNEPSLASNGEPTPTPACGADLHFVTIGGGAAATAAVCTLRQGGFAGRITVIDPVASEPTDRTNLSKMTLVGKKPVEKLPLWTPEERNELKVERIAARVTALDGDAGRLHATSTASSGTDSTISFDGALLATGGEPKKLGIPGEELPHVHSIRHVPDVEAILQLIGDQPESKKVALLGDSFIAFEAASALKTRGLQVTLVCRSPQPFSKRFGTGPAQALVGLHQSKGVTLHLGAEAREISVAAVTLKSGESIPADLVIVAVGVQVATDFSHGLQLQEDGGIASEASLKVQNKLWIAGDLAAVGGARIEHWRLAEQHGRIAAAGYLASLGNPLPAQQSQPGKPVPFFWTAHFGKRFGYIGQAEAWDELQVDGSLVDQKFLAYYMKGGRVAAVLGCGKDAAVAHLAERMRRPLTLEEARQSA
jgi:NADPH-dependent 2,4-dienoyl-CoA reductase/sulfur reductase-like enzyme/nitrite reductase/ring-hydroxylating ferredoxin subunit